MVAGRRTWEILFKGNTYFFISSEMLGRPEVQVTSSVDCWQKKEIDRQIFERFNMQKNRRIDRHIRDSIGKKHRQSRS